MSQAAKAKILCVDDDRRNLKLLEALLEPQGYAVSLCESGEEVLKKIENEIPDIILLDIIMPGMSGIDVLIKLRSDERVRLVPIILLTALQDEQDRIKGIQAGCDDFISKPFDKAELMARISSLLKMSYYRRELNEKEKFYTVIEDMSDGVIVCSPDYRVIDINFSAKKFLGIDKLENFIFLDHLYRNFSVSLARTELISPEVIHKDFDVALKGEEVLPSLYLQVNVDLLKDSAGGVASIVWILRDVTEERKDEIAKRSFLKFISHKLRLPLTIILEGISVLRDEVPGVLNAKQNDILSAISKKTIQLNMMIERLIKFTAIIREEECPAKEAINLETYIPILVAPLIDSLKDKKVDIRTSCENNQCVVILCRDYFDLIIECLVDNAIKFNDRALIVIDITMRPLTAGGFEFIVCDNGRGIPPDQQKNIFEKFYQAEKCFTGQVQGIGLGLPVVKHIVERSGGSISIKSEEGKGSVFTFTLM